MVLLRAQPREKHRLESVRVLVSSQSFFDSQSSFTCLAPETSLAKDAATGSIRTTVVFFGKMCRNIAFDTRILKGVLWELGEWWKREKAIEMLESCESSASHVSM